MRELPALASGFYVRAHYRACGEGFLRERVVVSALSGKTLLAGADDLHQVMCPARAQTTHIKRPRENFVYEAFQLPLARMSSKKPGQKSQLFENTLYALNCMQRASKACAPEARSRSTV